MRILLIMLTINLSLESFSQSIFAVKGGLNFSSISFKDYKPEKRKLAGFQGGITVTFPIDDEWSIQTGTYYTGKGVIFGRSHKTNKIDSFRTRLNYIELPVMAGYSFITGKNNVITVYGGAYFSYGFDGKTKTRTYSVSPIFYPDGSYKKIDWGFIASLQYKTNQGYGIAIDFSRSLFSVSKYKDEKEKNTVIGISLFWNFFTKRNED